MKPGESEQIPVAATGGATTELTRRSFLPAAGGIAAATLLPRHLLGGNAGAAPSDKLNIAAVGIGGMGANYIKGCESENIVALADVDDVLGGKVFALYPKARTYRDFRRMLEREKSIDAVIIGTPDHSHAVIAMAAMQLGKHVYVAKPMTRTIEEARMLTRTAREKRLATQMSVQSCASEGACATAEWIQAGAVGAVREVHVWTDRPVWPQGLARPTEHVKTPKTLDWDLWLGPSPERPYHPIYHPFNFRGWVDFGTGALGDMALHSFHVVFTALNLGEPLSVEASRTLPMIPALAGEADPVWSRAKKARYPETFPHSSIVTWEFAARGAQPPVRLHWYDGGLKPPRPLGMDPAAPWGAEGLIFVGDKGTLVSDFTGGPRLLVGVPKDSFAPPPKTLRRTPGHYQDWIAAAKGGPAASCNFEFARPMTETALLGVIAQRTGHRIAWDAATMSCPNAAEANALVRAQYRAGWSL